MNYWELRSIVKRLVPRQTRLLPTKRQRASIREKGRKSNYHQFNLFSGEFDKQERLLNTEEVSSFLEVSLRAQACPMPLNLDVWDGLRCGFGCRYCYADNFRASLYTSFFDNSKSMGLRHCNPEYYKAELDKLFKNRGKRLNGADEKAKAISLEIPMRFGIRFEDFLPAEGRKKISLSMLRYLADNEYPVMVNTKADLIGREDYVRALADNPAKAAVHITMITSDNEINRRLEPGAPPFLHRIGAAKQLTSAGVRVVARIEPFMVFINDHPDRTLEYMEALKDAGIRHITWDTYSYSAKNPTIRQAFYQEGFDFERMFTLMSDSQGIGSILLGKFMELFREAGFECSTFDLGNVPTNEDAICCSVGDWFRGGWNHGCIVSMIQFIIRSYPLPVSWVDYQAWVETSGGFLSEALRREVQALWNLKGNTAYCPNWAPGVLPHGIDQHGRVWRYDPSHDFREDLIEALNGVIQT